MGDDVLLETKEIVEHVTEFSVTHHSKTFRAQMNEEEEREWLINRILIA